MKRVLLVVLVVVLAGGLFLASWLLREWSEREKMRRNLQQIRLQPSGPRDTYGRSYPHPNSGP
jgi:hypothetical protein